MRIAPPIKNRSSSGLPRRAEEGSAVIVVLALLAIVLVYVAGNIGTLNHLGRDLALVERQQLHRLAVRVGQTQAPVATQPAALTPAAGEKTPER